MSLLTADQRAALTELVNISFGRSMAALSDLLGVFINLSVPEVRITRAGQVLDYLESVFGEDRQLTLVQQTFNGDFFGEAALTLPHQSGATLVQMLDEQSGFRPAMEPDALEMEVLLEVGNIVIGACLSQFAQMLNTQLSFDPPAGFLGGPAHQPVPGSVEYESGRGDSHPYLFRPGRPQGQRLPDDLSRQGMHRMALERPRLFSGSIYIKLIRPRHENSRLAAAGWFCISPVDFRATPLSNG